MTLVLYSLIFARIVLVFCCTLKWLALCYHKCTADFACPQVCSSSVRHLGCIPQLDAVATSSLQLRTAEDTVLQVLE